LIKEKSNRKREIDISGSNGNTYVLLGVAQSLCTQLKEVNSELYNFTRISDEMTESDYDNLIKVFDRYFGDFVDLVR